MGAFCLPKEKKCLEYVTSRPGGGIGIHTWLRAMALRACGFESRPGHTANKTTHMGRFVVIWSYREK